MNVLLNLTMAMDSSFGLSLDDEGYDDELGYLRQLEKELDSRARASRRRSRNTAEERAKQESENLRRRILKAFMRPIDFYDSDFLTDLLTHGVNNPIDGSGSNAVHLCCQFQNKQVLNGPLLDQMAIVALTDNEKAARHELWDVVMDPPGGVKSLDLSARNLYGYTPVDVAFALNSADERMHAVEMLMSLLAKQGNYELARKLNVAFKLAHAMKLESEFADRETVLDAQEDATLAIVKDLGVFINTPFEVPLSLLETFGLKEATTVSDLLKAYVQRSASPGQLAALVPST